MSPEAILVDNLRVTLDRTQRYMGWGTGSALFLLLMVTADPASRVSVQLPGGFAPADPLLAASIVTAAYWVVGALASYGVARAKRIVDALRPHPELLEAVLTYPSVPTTRIHGPRLGAALLPAVLFGITVVIDTTQFDSPYTWLGLVLLVSPYLTLTLALRTALGGKRPDSHGD